MTNIIIDRRKNAKGRSTVNRQRYMRRVRDQVRESVKDVIREGNIKDIVDQQGKKIKIYKKGLNQPTFHHAKEGGKRNIVHSGNEDFIEGDRINRPPSGSGEGGSQGSADGEGEDEFSFTLTREEFLDIFFEDLELPDLVKKQITKIDEHVYRRAGFSVDGNPSRLNIVRSMKQSRSRRVALQGPKRKKLRELQEELNLLLKIKDPNKEQINRISFLEEEIKKLKAQIRSIPFIDDVDLRYNRWEKVPTPSTQAVMFCLMDVSYSMGEWEKEMSKRFFMLLYLFLMQNYERVEIEFIRHTHVASLVTEEEFFHSRETGGTIVSTSLELMHETIQRKYPPGEWNIFGCQASDGDNFADDLTVARDMLRQRILPLSQYYAYIEIDQNGKKTSNDHSHLWQHYEEVAQVAGNMQMAVVTEANDIYPVFRGLFEKRER